MSDKKVLTKEIAEQFLGDNDSLDLSEFTAIEDAAAESCGKHKGDLHLNGLTTLSDAAVDSLGRLQRGRLGWARWCFFSQRKARRDLHLDGLTELSDAGAESLSKHKGWLSLDGLTELSDAAAESLSKQPAERVAEEIGKGYSWLRGRYLNGDLSLDSLRELSDGAAESLRRHKGNLYLDVDKLPVSAAQILRDSKQVSSSPDESPWAKMGTTLWSENKTAVVGRVICYVIIISVASCFVLYRIYLRLPHTWEMLFKADFRELFASWVVGKWKNVFWTVIGLIGFFWFERNSAWRGEKVAANKKREKRQKRRKLESKKITENLKEHGITKFDLPAIICHCHSCSRVSVVTQKCGKCGISAKRFEQISDTSRSATAFACPCGWSHEAFTCPCGTENSAVRFGLYVIEEAGDGGRHTVMAHHCGMRC